jgi:hypothetical protein
MRGTSTLNCVWNARLLRYHHQHHMFISIHLKLAEDKYGNPLMHARITHLGVKPLCSQ